jgi:hypothetical protein
MQRPISSYMYSDLVSEMECVDPTSSYPPQAMVDGFIYFTKIHRINI